MCSIPYFVLGMPGIPLGGSRLAKSVAKSSQSVLWKFLVGVGLVTPTGR